MKPHVSPLSTNDYKELFIKKTNQNLKPKTVSYFTGSPFFNDLLIQLNDLIHKYKNHPAVMIDKKSAKTTLWKLRHTLNDELDLHLKPNDYRKIVLKLNRLDKIIPRTAPKVREFLKYFQRDPFGKSALHSGENLQDGEEGFDPQQQFNVKKERQLDKYGRSYAVGRRKEASAQVYLIKGNGQVIVNGKPLADYFRKLQDRESILYPFEVTRSLGDYNVFARVRGGGTTGQSGAITHGITKCLLIHNSELKPILRKAKLVAHDSRRVERKKPGRAKARKGYTWVKR
ncbi:hypothetical protein G9A89_014944 [Geosiphon pyriformis]|nr:hypothetical protein G9A89_014944 [Geosiphon pyriformis]